MYYEPPYGGPYPPMKRPAVVRPNRRWQLTPLRWCFLCSCIIFSLLILAGLITFIVLYFVRNRDRIDSLLTYPDFYCNQRPCGCPRFTTNANQATRVVGGKEAAPYLYPWLVGLTNRYRNEPFCTGSIISSRAVLTAAHCLSGRTFGDVQILSKLHDIRQFSGDRHDIQRWYIYPEYRFNESFHLNDIAILIADRPFAADIQRCCLPSTFSTSYPRPSTTSVVGGWGQIMGHPDAPTSPVLQHVVMPIVDHRNKRCRSSLIDSNRQICAGYDRLSVDTCSGDSGSPLLVVERDGPNQGHFVAAGIVSYGNVQCDASISSGIYTRVSFYVPWIQSILTSS